MAIPPFISVRYIELYLCLYCVSCNPSLYGLYNERSPPLPRVCGVSLILYMVSRVRGPSPLPCALLPLP